MKNIKSIENEEIKRAIEEVAQRFEELTQEEQKYVAGVIQGLAFRGEIKKGA